MSDLVMMDAIECTKGEAVCEGCNHRASVDLPVYVHELGGCARRHCNPCFNADAA